MEHRLIEIIEIKHIRNKQVIWQNFNLKNILHSQGEDYFLKILFSNIISKPAFYYFGLDDRLIISATDILSDINTEPVINNYSRQVANSTDDWTFDISSGDNRAKSPILTFGAHGGSWGPIRNLFLTMQPQNISNLNGYLISSVALGSSITVIDGDSISMRMAATLKNCYSGYSGI